MAQYSIFSDYKLNELLSKLINNPDEITVSEKLILIGNLSEMVNRNTGSIVNTINTIINNGHEVSTVLAPSTLNNLLSDLHMYLNDGFGVNINLNEKYDYIDITSELNKRGIEFRDKVLRFKPVIKTVKTSSNYLNSKNDELEKMIRDINLDLIIKIYIIINGLTYA